MTAAPGARRSHAKYGADRRAAGRALGGCGGERIKSVQTNAPGAVVVDKTLVGKTG
jgi:hypothetical protein